MKAKYIQVTDFCYKDVEIVNAHTEKELLHILENKKILKIYNYGEIEYINSYYIMFLKLDRNFLNLKKEINQND